MINNYTNLSLRYRTRLEKGKGVAGGIPPATRTKAGYSWLVSLLLLVTSFFIGTESASAQTNIANYSFSTGTSAYTPISVAGGATLLYSTWDSNVSSSITIPSFPFGGTNVTTCFINSNGYITFGAASSTFGTTPLSTSVGTGAIAAFAQDGSNSTVVGATPSIMYQNTGTEFVVQFTDHANYNNRTVERLNFQIRLTYATGAINIVYGTCTNPGNVSGSGTTMQVGIRGNTTTYASNVNNLMIANTPAGTTCDWSNAVTGFSNSSTMYFNGTASGNVNVKIPTGLTYTWLPGTQAPVRSHLAVSAITPGGATVSWTAPTGATTYNVQYRVPGTCSWTNWSGNPVSGTSAVLTGLTSLTSYQVRVQALNGAAQSIYSHIPNAAGTGDGYTSTGTFTTIAALPPNCIASPTSPANSATGVVSSVLTWPAATGNPTGYTLYYGTDPAATNIINGLALGNVTTYTIPNPLTASTVYYWKIVPTNVYGAATGCATWSFTSGTVPNCATALLPADTATGVARNPTLSWTAATGSPASYDVYLSTTTPATFVGNVTGTSFVPTGVLLANTLYYYKVVPKNVFGSAVGCVEQSFTTGANIVYCLPVTSYGCGDGDVIARVTLNTLDNNSGTGCPSDPVPGNQGIGTNGPGYSDYTNLTVYPTLTTTLQAGSSYGCTVYAGQWAEGYAAWIDYNDDGTFAASERIGFSSGQVAGSGVAGVLGSSATFPIVLACNPPVGQHRLRVRAMYNTNGSAVTACGDNSYGEIEDYLVTITAADPCPKPTALAAADVTTTTATLSWVMGCAETNWEVAVQEATVLTPPASGTAVNTNTYAATGLTVGTNHVFYVRAACTVGSLYSAWAGPFAFTTVAVIPNCVTSTTPSNGATGITSNVLSWSAPSSGPAATGYTLYFGTDGGGLTTPTNINNGTVLGNVLTYTLPFTLTPGTTYYWQVIATNADGIATGCAIRSFVALNVPNCATALVPANAATNVTRNAPLSWTAATGSPASYDVYLSTTTPATFAANVTGTTYTPSTTLLANTLYYYKVVAKNAAGSAIGCVEQTFTTGINVNYCTPVTTYGCTDGDVIARVTLNTLDNNSGTGCPSGTLGYSNYTDLSLYPTLTTTLQAGSSYGCTVYAGQYTEGYAAWIDYNDDGTFSASERIGFSLSQVTGSGTAGVLGSSATFPIVLACNPPLGQHRLRVRAMYSTNGSAVTPCGDNSFGEVEDYLVTISAADPCPKPTTLAAGAITTTGATLSWVLGCAETNWEVAVQEATVLTPPASGTAVNTTTYTASGLAVGKDHVFYVRAACTPGSLYSSWAGPFAFTTLPYAPGCGTNVSPANGTTNLSLTPGFATLTWTAPAATLTEGAATSYDVYGGATSGALSLLGNTTATTVDITGLGYGQTFFWRIVPRNAGGTAVGPCTEWSFSTQALPANDICSGATSLDGLTSPITGSTSGLTDDFLASCGSSSTAPDSFYSITVPNGYTLTINDTASAYDNANSLFYGSCGTQIFVSCLDANLGVQTWTNTTGSTQTAYWVQDGWSSGSGFFTLAWTLTPPPVVVTDFNPPAVCGTAGGTVITINGSNFTNASDVQFNGISVGAGNFTVINDGQITAILPPGNTAGYVRVVKVPSAAGYGDSTTAFINNTFLSPGTISSTSGSFTLCMPTVLDLNSSAPSGEWSVLAGGAFASVDGNGIVTGIAEGSATIKYAVTSTAGCVSSVNQNVVVKAPVSISGFTTSQTTVPAIFGGPGTASFSVSATGSGLTYQWFATDGLDIFTLGTDATGYGETYTGYNSATLSISGISPDMNGFEYYCIVSGASPCSPQTTSPNSSLIVATTGIAQDPLPAIVCGSGSTSFTVVKSGTAPTVTYAWEYQTSGVGPWLSLTNGYSAATGLTFADADTATLAISGVSTANNGYRFRAKITGPTNVATSEGALLTVSAIIATDLSTTEVKRCKTPAPAATTLSITTSGAVNSVVWKYTTTAGAPNASYTSVAVSPPTGVSYVASSAGNVYSLAVTTTSAASAATYYYKAFIVGFGSCPDVVSANPAKITVVNPAVAITASSTAYCSPGAPVTLSTPAGLTGYSWSSSPAGFSDSSNAISVSPLSATTYTVTGTDSNGCTNSASQLISVGSSFTVNATASQASVCQGTAVTLNSSLALTGGLLNPSTAGGFESGATFPLNGWTVVNGTSNNWFVGNAAGVQSGTNAAYIGTNNVATANTSYNHFYRDIAIPAGLTNISLQFYLKMAIIDNTYDYVKVFTTSTANTPVAGTLPGLGYTQVFSYTTPALANYTLQTVSLPNALAGTTVRIVFTYQSDSVSPYSAPAIDSILLTSGSTPTYTYAWSSTPAGFSGSGASTSATPTANTVYKVVATSNLGCTAEGFTNSVTFIPTPTVTSTNNGQPSASHCGPGKVNLTATGSAGTTVQWYAASTGGAPLFEGNNFETPSLAATTNYWVQSTAVGAPSTVNVGAGAGTSSSSGASPYYHGYGGQKAQYIIRATDLVAAGFSAGNLNSLGFEITSLGTASLSGFSISLGTTTQTTATSNTAIMTGLTSVYSNSAQTLTLGVNNYTFATPFYWNGTSNLVVQVCYSNNNSGGTSSTVKTDTAAYTSTLGIYADNASAAAILAASSSTGLGSTSSNTTTSTRPRMLFGFAPFLCQGARTQVAAVITTPPALALTSSSATLCEGESTTVNITPATVGNYTSYTWTPEEGIEGRFDIGYTFTPAATTTYTLSASEAGGCNNTTTFTVTVNPKPSVPVLSATTPICQGSALNLTSSVVSNSASNTLISQNFESGLSGWTTTNTSTTTGTGNVALAAWTERSTGYAYSTDTFTGNQGTKFYMTNSDAAGSGVTVNTTLVSPSFSTVGYTGLSVSFSHYYRHVTAAGAFVDVSTDGGANWTNVQSYSATTGTAGAFAAASVNLNAYVGNANVKIRFRHAGAWYYYWAVDAIVVSASSAPSFAWSGPNSFTSSVQNPSIAGATPAASGNYALEVTNSYGCKSNATVAATVHPTPVAIAPANQVYFNGLATAAITLGGTPSGVTFDISGGASVGLADATGLTQVPSFIPVTGSATVVIVPKANGCTGSSVSYNIVVSAVSANPIANQEYCQGVTTAAIPLSHTPTSLTGVTYTILGGASVGLADVSGVTAIPSFVAIPGTATITVIPQYGGVSGGAVTGTILVNPLPTATIAGSTPVCRNDAQPIVTFTAANGTAPYTFSYRFNGGAIQTIVSSGNTATIAQPTGTPGTFTYTLVSVKDSSSTTCSNPQSGTVTIVVHPTPTVAPVANQSYYSGFATAAIPLTGTPSGVTFNISGGAASGLADVNGVTAIPSFIPTTTPSTVTITPVANGCVGVPVTYQIAFNPVVVNISSNVCGGVNHGLNNQINCTQVSVPGYTTTGYMFEVTNTATGEVAVVFSSQHHFKLTDSNNYAYGTTFTIRVAAVLNGQVQGYFGSTCSLTTASVQTSRVVTAQCGSTLVFINSTINANSVSSTNLYRFRVALASAPTVTYLVERSVPNFKLTDVVGLPLLYNAEYLVDVQIRVKLAGFEAWSQYGVRCSIFTPAAPETSLVNSQCEDYAVPSSTSPISAIAFPGATAYRFRLTGYDGFGDVNYQQAVTNAGPSFTLSQFSGLTPGATYTVAVAMELFGTFTDYAKDCSIVVPLVGKQAVVEPFKATAYPNPFAANFMIDVKTTSDSVITIKVYDMVGRLVEQKTATVAQLETSPIGNNYPSGVYNVVVTQDETVQTVRVVKR